MKRRFQIVIAPHNSGAQTADDSRLTRFGRIKTILIGLGFAAVSIAVLIVALVLGYIIAAILCAVIVLAVAVLLLRSAFRTKHR